LQYKKIASPGILIFAKKEHLIYHPVCGGRLTLSAAAGRVILCIINLIYLYKMKAP
jgi:hypothetical protein